MQVAREVGLVAAQVHDEVGQDVLRGVERLERAPADLLDALVALHLAHALVDDRDVGDEARPQERPVAAVQRRGVAHREVEDLLAIGQRRSRTQRHLSPLHRPADADPGSARS
jgi:hypothetical protein